MLFLEIKYNSGEKAGLKKKLKKSMSYWSEKLHLYSEDKKKLRKCEKEI